MSSELPNVEKSHSASSPQAYLLPLVAILLVSLWYPSFAPEAYQEDRLADPTAPWKYAFWITVQLVVAGSVFAWFARDYQRDFPFSVSGLGILVGVLGGGIWIWMCGWGLEREIYTAMGLDSLGQTRPSFNPFLSEQSGLWQVWFFTARFALLVVAIPIAEEFFLRAWLIRWVESPNWDQVSLRQISAKGIGVVVLYAVITHPSEAIAAAVWFSGMSWLMLRTGRLWDCVAAHAITNLILGVYVVLFAKWELW